jgi:hypothetical protein
VDGKSILYELLKHSALGLYILGIRNCFFISKDYKELVSHSTINNLQCTHESQKKYTHIHTYYWETEVDGKISFQCGVWCKGFAF